MSRIYEALQRADMERKGALPAAQDTPQYVASIPPVEAEVTNIVEPEVAPQVEAPVRIVAEADLDKIRLHPWTPFMDSFPTLADRGAAVEQFRALRTRIFQCRYEAPLKTILVSSGMPGEGKTFVTMNLALSLARNSVNQVNNILLIDGDLRRPTVHTLLGAPNEPGLSEYLAGDVELHQILQRASNPELVETNGLKSISNITFIPAGKCGDNASDVVSNRRIVELIDALSPHFDWILVDSPPVLAVTDAVELARAADGVLLVARGEKTPFDVARRAQIAFGKSRVLGFVLNDVKDAPFGEGGYYYYGAGDSNKAAESQVSKRRNG